MNFTTLENLQWSLLLEKVAAHAQTAPGKKLCLNLPTDLSADATQQRWAKVEPLRDLTRSGYTAPIGELPELEAIFKSVKVGQILEGEALRSIGVLLETTKRIQRFAADFSSTNTTLAYFSKLLYPLPKLMQAIAQSIGPSGEILDTASPELAKIRISKVALRGRIEHEIRQLLVDEQIEMYLQDKFFTVRAERYVIPIKLDGRGRVKGSIYDTSASGQTLYMEPAKIAPMNEDLLELELSEKLEVLRIFRELSTAVATDYDIIAGDYEQIVALDFLAAQASFAHSCNAIAIPIITTPALNLTAARHPLITSPDGRTAVPNDISLSDKQTSLIISGPNAGGKTVVLKTVGIIHLMAKAGLMLPVAPESTIYLFNNIYLSLGDTQSITAGLSTFSGHILGLKPIIENATKDDLALLDELAVGTDPQTGSAIGQAILESLAQNKVTTISSTHFDSLKGLALENQVFRNGSMEFSIKTLRPTYRLVLDLPGQSYGLEVAQQMGLPEAVIRRAKQLKGDIGSQLDRLVGSLNSMRDEVREEYEKTHATRLAMEEQKAHFKAECSALAELRKETARKLKEKYDLQMQKVREEANDALAELQKLVSQAKQNPKKAHMLGEDLTGQRRIVRQTLAMIDNALDDMNLNDQELALEPIDPQTLKVGDSVMITTIRQEGTVRKIPKENLTNDSQIEVAAGNLSLKIKLEQLKRAPRGANSPKSSDSSRSQPRQKQQAKEAAAVTDKIEFAISTPTNTLDLRGQDVDGAIAKCWIFIDKALLRGEKALIIIHGHGTDRLKRALRGELAERSPYPLKFRPGEENEGGDGVTVIKLD